MSDDDLPKEVRERVERRLKRMPAWVADHVTEGQLKLGSPKFWSKLVTLPYEVNGLRSTDRLVLLALAAFTNDVGRSWVSVVNLAEAAAVQRATVHRCLRRVAFRVPTDWPDHGTAEQREQFERAWVLIHSRGAGRSNLYKVVVPQHDPSDLVNSSPPPGEQLATPLATESPPPGEQVSRGGEQVSTEVSKEVAFGSPHVSGNEAGPPNGVPVPASPSGNGKTDLEAVRSELRGIIDSAGSLKERSKRAGKRAGRRRVGRDDAEELVEELSLDHQGFLDGWEVGARV